MPTFHTTILLARQTATGLEVPPAVIDELGAGKKPAVVVTVSGAASPDGYEYRSTVGIMSGKFLIPLSSDHRKASGFAAGDEVEVALALDDAPREVAVPADLASALDASGVRAAFDALSHSRKRALVEPIEQAKAADTRARRVAKAVESLA
ncbi:YdeI/OmpD-associated family protein [Frondihabitans cladoniiphilus]|uniref:Bacteriocin resistance YdeI/OmpD-like protein n=1 Tax=Frondihabitans cladoniiphilus TaxID=715785 RepID=A0ABP8WFX3_9MICO